MEENDRFTNTNFAEVFGALEKTHRVRRGCFEKFFIPATIFMLLLFSILTYVASEDWLVIPVCVLPFAVMFVGIVWHLYKTRGDELRIYEHGFTYKSRKIVQTCLWKDIKSCHRRELSAEEIILLKDERFPLDSVKKKSGETIEFADELDGTHEIRERFESSKPPRRSKSKT